MDNTSSRFRKSRLMACLFSLLALFLVLPANAQRVSVKTNALYWAVCAPNAGLEFRINRHTTLNLEAAFQRFDHGKYDTRALVFTPEARYWFSARPQAGHFVGVTALAANYDITVGSRRHNGDAFGGGVTYGYSFVLGRHWSLETTVDVGALYRHEKDSRNGNEPSQPNVSKVNFAPLKAGVTFVYIIR